MDAVEALMEAGPGTPTFMIGVQENKITRVPLMDAVKMVSSLTWSILSLLINLKTRAVSTAVADLDFEKALELRGPEFQEMLVAFHAISSFPESSACLPAKKRMKIGILQYVAA